jgi:hypothetical protein
MKNYFNRPLLTFNNAKTVKGQKKNFVTAIMYLSPFTLNSKGVNLCPMASEGCANACLFESGFGGMYQNVKNGRMEKTEFYLSNRIGFLDKLVDEITKLEAKYKDSEYTLAIRLNGTSDISFEKQITSNGKTIFDTFKNIQFYDYTKNYKRFDKKLPDNYHLTFSLSETNFDKAIELLGRGVNVAMVMDKLVDNLFGYPVINGDETDLRFTDPKNVIVGLKYKKITGKGGAEKNKEALESGFVINTKKVLELNKVV